MATTTNEVPYSPFIRDMPQDSRPRERLEQWGAELLADYELLAIMVRTGTRSISAVQLAQLLLQRFGGLRQLDAASIEELSEVNGIGLAKACQLKAAFTLGKRLSTAGDSRPTVTSPESVANLVMEDLRYQKKEHYGLLFLNTRNEVIKKKLDVSVGSLNASIVHPRETFRDAISHTAAAIILVHNHPSGDPTPSKEDISLTARMVEAGTLLGIPVFDHLIIGDGIFVSLKAKGLM
jgi:DNA repair protein RadC